MMFFSSLIMQTMQFHRQIHKNAKNNCPKSWKFFFFLCQITIACLCLLQNPGSTPWTSFKKQLAPKVTIYFSVCHGCHVTVSMWYWWKLGTIIGSTRSAWHNIIDILCNDYFNSIKKLYFSKFAKWLLISWITVNNFNQEYY